MYIRPKTYYYLVYLLKCIVLIALIYHILFFTKIVWRVFLVRDLSLRIFLTSSKTFQPEKEPPLILLWNRYQKTGSGVYRTIFQRITEGHCKVCLNRDLCTQFSPILSQTVCRVTQDKNLQNLSAAIVFHMPVRDCLLVG